MPVKQIASLSDISDDYDLILCDVWGVLHNGVDSWADAARALIDVRQAGKTVILITNSPRRSRDVVTQLQSLGVPDEAYDGIVTSGDVTRTLIAEGPRRIFHLGADRDLSLFDGLDVELVEEFEASGVACTGLFDDEAETPEDYAEMLKRLRARDLPFICANPDIVVERGDRLIWCAGSLARDYGQLGGRTLIAGKPHRPIYEKAMKDAAELMGKQTARERMLAIGDGMTTDVKGAMMADIPLLFISDGIHAREYGSHGAPDLARMAEFLDDFGAEPVATMTKLR